MTSIDHIDFSLLKILKAMSAISNQKKKKLIKGIYETEIMVLNSFSTLFKHLVAVVV